MRVMWIAAAVACSGTPPPPAQPTAPPAAVIADAAVDAAPLDQDLARLADRSLAMYQDVAKAFAAAGESCATATASLRKLATAYRDVVTANAKVLQDGRAAQLRIALKPRDDEFSRAAQAVVQSQIMSKCSQDPTFMKAFDELLAPPP